MTLLAKYTQIARDMLAGQGDTDSNIDLISTLFRAGDLAEVRGFYWQIEDPEDRVYALRDILYDATPDQLWFVLEGQELTDDHADILSALFEDPKLDLDFLRQVLDQAAASEIVVTAQILGEIAKRGDVQDAERFLANNTLPNNEVEAFVANIAIGHARNGNLEQTRHFLRQNGGYHRGAALIEMAEMGIDPGFINREVDAALDNAFAETDRPNVGFNTLGVMLRVPGQWPRLMPVVEEHQSAAAEPYLKANLFHAVWKSTGAEAAWALLPHDVSNIDTQVQVQNILVETLHQGDSYFANRALAEFKDEDTKNSIRKVMSFKALERGELDAALALVFQVVPLNEPAEYMQPYYRDTAREHVMEALQKAGRIKDQIALLDHMEQAGRQLTWTFSLSLQLTKLGRDAEAEDYAAKFNALFETLGAGANEFHYNLIRKAALLFVAGHHDQAFAYARKAESWSQESFPASVGIAAIPAGRHFDLIVQTLVQTWDQSAQDDAFLMIEIIAGLFELETAQAGHGE